MFLMREQHLMQANLITKTEFDFKFANLNRKTTKNKTGQ